ncbi:hypothetical protein ACOKWN_003863 [Vibrio parahaemolyticus]
MSRYYRLGEDFNVYPSSLEEWAFGDRPTKPIQQEDVFGTWVSTIFLGLDHGFNWYPDVVTVYRPVLFETCLFGGLDYSDVVRRYECYDDAIKGHREVVDEVIEQSRELVRLGSVRRAKRHFNNECSTNALRQWYAKHYRRMVKAFREDNVYQGVMPCAHPC